MKTFTLRNKVVFVAAVAVVALTSYVGLARASDLGERPALTVHYSDLNLDTQAGAAALYQRIRHAAEQVCGKVDSRRLDQIVAAQDCMSKAIASSVSAVGNAQLTREYVARVGKAPKQIVMAAAR
jgi:UrcA family protein